MGFIGTLTNTDNSIPDGTIQNKELVSAQISLGGVAINLGETIAQPAFDLTLATNLKSAELDNGSVSYGGVTLNLGDSDPTPAFDLTDATNYPTSSLSGTITNAQLAGSISNDKLANSTVSYGGVQLALGGSDATPAFNLTDATNYNYNNLTNIPDTIAELSNDDTPQLGGTLDTNGNLIQFGDSASATDDRLQFGASQDLQIYHDGSNSRIHDSGTGVLAISGSQIRIENATQSETSANFIENGAVELYYDNSKKFETITSGVLISNGASDTATIAGPANLLIDPAVVGDNTGIVRIKGDLFVDGTTTQINSTDLNFADFVIGIASTATTDVLADGAGIKIGPDNTFLYDHTNTSLKSSENLNLASGKTYKINGTDVLSSTSLGSNVTSSSLTSVGTITTGTWQGSTISATYIEDKFLKNDVDDTATGQITINNGTAAPLVLARTSQVGIEFDDTSTGKRYLGVSGGNLYYGTALNHGTNNTVWHSGNDGASSTLDADLLDGQEGTYYQNATNLNAGTVNTARLPNTYTKAAGVTIQATGTGNDVTIDAADHIFLESGEEEDGNIYFRGNGGEDSYRFAKSGQTTIEGFLSFESLTTDRTFTFPDTTGTIALTSSTVANATNAGNADTLDNQEGTYYQNATNLNAGTVNTARLPNTYTKAATVTIQATGSTNDVIIDAADNIILESGEEEDGNIYFRGNGGTDSYRFAKSGQTAIEGFLSFESITTDRTFTFPDVTGTLALTSSTVANATTFDSLTKTSMAIADARRAGWVPTYTNATEADVVWNYTENAVELKNPSDNTGGAAYKAIRMKSSDTVRIQLQVKGSSANVSGLYLRIYFYNGDLPDGKTHVSRNATYSLVQEEDSFDHSWWENNAISASYVGFETTYTASADGYMSVVVLNWTAFTGSLYVLGPDIQFEKVFNASNAGDADTLDGIDSGSFLRSDADATATGAILIQNQVRSTSQIRATGWYESTTGTTGNDLGFEIGVSAGEAYALSYNRATSSYGAMNLAATIIDLQPQGGNAGDARVSGNRILTVADEGSGNGLDADTLDGIDSGSFLRSDATDDFSGILQGNNVGGTYFNLRGGGSSDTKILRVSAAENNEDISSNNDADFGFNIRYRGDLSTNENALQIDADNQAGTSVESLRIKQDGIVYFNLTPKVGGNDVLTTADTYSALSADADENIFLGTDAGGSYDASTNNALYNLAIGYCAGSSITEGDDNVFLGRCAGFCNTTQSNSIAIGSSAGRANAADNNIYLGEEAGWSSTRGTTTVTGINNFFAGVNAGGSTTNGCRNTFIGFEAGYCNTGGDSNTFIGHRAGCRNTDGQNNNFLGAYAGRSNTTGCSNNFIGNNAGANNGTGGCNNFIGANAGSVNNSGSHNNFFGSQAGNGNNSGCYNNFLGLCAGRYNTCGCDNNFFGYEAGYCNTTACHNTFIGKEAGKRNTTGCYNNFFGLCAGYCSTGSNVIAIGKCAGYSNSTGGDNIYLGREAGLNSDRGTTVVTGSGNFMVGVGAGGSTTSGFTNIFIGCNAGYCNTTGFANIFLGSCAGSSHVSGFKNIFIGSDAGCCFIDGDLNVFIGSRAGFGMTEGVYNVFFGCGAGECATGGCNNNFMGREAGRYNTTGAFNNFFGRNAGEKNSDGRCNVFIGCAAGKNNTIACCNTFIGTGAGFCNTQGEKNVFIGSFAGNRNNTASCSVMIGHEPGRCAITTGNNNVFIGTYSGKCASGSSDNNIAIGLCAGRCIRNGFGHNNFLGRFSGMHNLDGDYNNFLGCTAGYCNTQGRNNNFIGKGAGYYNTLGGYNNFFGEYAGRKNTIGSDNNFMGRQVGNCNLEGCNNNFFGTSAGYRNTCGSCNIFIGKSAGYCNTCACYNIFLGCAAGQCNLTGDRNIFIGRAAGNRNDAGINNVFLGDYAGYCNKGDYNTYIGCWAGKYGATTSNHNISIGCYSGLSNTNGDNNTFMGQGSGRDSLGSNNIAIGCWAGTSTGGLCALTGASNAIIMGNSAHTLSCIQTAWSAASDIRDKCVYGEVPYGKAFLENVNTIKYSFKNRETDEITDDRKRYGFSAQEIASLEDEPIIVPNPDDDKLGLTHEYLLPVVVNAIKELSAENQELRERIIVLENAVGIST